MRQTIIRMKPGGHVPRGEQKYEILTKLLSVEFKELDHCVKGGGDGRMVL
jgi:hypothetical protein